MCLDCAAGVKWLSFLHHLSAWCECAELRVSTKWLHVEKKRRFRRSCLAYFSTWKICVVLGYARPLPQEFDVLEQGFVLISDISGCRCSALRIICLPQLFFTNYCNWRKKKKTFTIVYWIFNYYSNTLLLLLLMLRVIFKLETAGISQPIFSVLLCWFIWRSSVFQCLLRKLQIIWAHDENTLTIKGHGWLLAMNKRQIIKKCKCKMMNNCW